MVKYGLVLAVLLTIISTGAQDNPAPKPAPNAAKPAPKAAKGSHPSQRCDGDPCVYNLATAKVTGDTVRGPRTIKASGLNTLRYDYQWNNTITFGAAPDLWSKLASINTSSSSPPPAQQQPAPAVKPAAGENIPAEIKPIIDQADRLYDDTEAHVKSVTDLKDPIQNNANDLSNMQQNAASATAVVTAGGKSLNDFLGTSTGEAAVLIPQMKDQLADTDAPVTPKATQDSLFVAGTKALWPDPARITAIHNSSQTLANQTDTLKTNFSTYVPQQTAAMEAAKGSLNSQVAKLQQESQTAADARKTVISNELQMLNDRASNLNKAESDLTYANQLLMNWEIPTNSQTLTSVADLDVGGSKYLAFRSAQDALVTWKRRMETLLKEWSDFDAHPDQIPDPFSMEIHTDCGFAFSRTKTNALTLTRTDRMPGSTTTAATPETVLSLSVECTSPFTVSAGVAFSFIQDNEFGIQAVPVTQGSMTTTTNEIIPTVKSSFHPLPLGMIHARLWEPNDIFSFHASLGIAADIRSQSAGGSDPAYLIGPSVALFRTMFITPGVLIGPQVSLASGFTEGVAVPSTITTVPLQKSYKAGFGLGITFTKP